MVQCVALDMSCFFGFSRMFGHASRTPFHKKRPKVQKKIYICKFYGDYLHFVAGKGAFFCESD